MGNIKISVIVPVYNTEAYLKQALNSITDQTLREFEILIINDGSTDNSLSIANDFASRDPRISIFTQENKGQSVARNLGMKHATGKYLYFMDSDDILDKDAFQSCFDRCELEGLDLVLFDAKVFGDTSTEARLTLDYRRHDFLGEDVYTGHDLLKELLRVDKYFASPCLYLVRASLLRQIELMFYPGIIHEDELFTFQLFLHSKKISYLPYAYFHRRIRSNSTMTLGFSKKNIDGYYQVAHELKKLKEGKSNLTKTLINIRLRSIINGVFYNSRGLNIPTRWYTLRKYLPEFLPYAHIKNITLLAFPVTRLLTEKRIGMLSAAILLKSVLSYKTLTLFF